MYYPLAEKVLKTYHENFTGEPIIVRAPGRVNIIGEHTDYNEGFVLPASINKATFVAVGKRTDNIIQLISNDYNEKFEIELSNIQPLHSWPTYILGVTDQIIQRGYLLGGFNLVIQGDVPIGAGLSSSASVECATAFALNELFQLHIASLELIDIAQKAEHKFAGVMCGVMDQFISILGKKDHVIKLDCRSMEYEYEPLQLNGIKVILFNSNVKHSLASSEYNTRRIECNEGIRLIKNSYPAINSLRDVSVEMLLECVESVDNKIYRRCKYVVEENARLLHACSSLVLGDIMAVGKKMYESHNGLSTEYEVSCKELDFLVDHVRNKPGVLGARMMGGGFGGCTINLVKEEFVDELIANTSAFYTQNIGKELTTYITITEDGASRIY